MIWWPLTLQTYLLLPIVNKLLSFEILISPYPDFGLLLKYGKHLLDPFIWSKLDKFTKSFQSLDIFKKRIEMVYFTTLWDNAWKDFFLCYEISKKWF